MYNRGYQSAAQFAMEYGGKVHVADNHRISVTLKESVYEAKHMADRGCGAGDIKEYLPVQHICGSQLPEIP